MEPIGFLIFALIAVVIVVFLMLPESALGDLLGTSPDQPSENDHNLAVAGSDATLSNIPENGHLFEKWTADLISQRGWDCKVTPKSGDNGIDVIARKSGLSVGIQCKRTLSSTGIKGVQEAFSGATFYGLDLHAVLSTGGFTKSARDMASKSQTYLLAPADLATFFASLEQAIEQTSLAEQQSSKVKQAKGNAQFSDLKAELQSMRDRL